MPSITWDRIKEDVRTVFDRDPAARSTLEILLTYPGVHALFFYRVAHWLWRRDVKLFARFISNIGRFVTGVDIHPGANIGRRLFIDHGMGVVIGETTDIADDVTLYQGVTLGGTSLSKGKRHPTIEDHVVITTGATVLGPVAIGTRSRIGAGSVVIHPVPPDSTVVGIPGRVVRHAGAQHAGGLELIDLDHGDLPDPVARAISILLDHVEKLEHKLNDLTARQGAAEDRRAEEDEDLQRVKAFLERGMMAVYADYAAAAPLRPEARAAMLEALDAGLGNASSVHAAGTRARARVEAAREEVAAAIGAQPLEIVFTSGATESNNLALFGVAGARETHLHLAVPASEHASVLAPGRTLAAAGHALTLLPVGSTGRTDATAVTAAAPDLLSVALVNAETGVIQDVHALGERVRRNGGVVHVDAAQAAAYLPIDVDTLGVDLLTLASCKLGGPAGAGALYVRRGTALTPALRGGPQEQGRRAGSENVAAIVGFATALALANAEREREAVRIRTLGDRLRTGIATVWPGARFTLPAEIPASPHIVSVTLSDAVVGEDVVAALDLAGIAAATGSACAAGAAEPSHVLLAMGRSVAEARAGLRLSLGWASTASDVDAIVQALARVRARVGERSKEAAWPAHGS